MIKLLFWTFFKTAIMTFGGGYAMVTLFYDELVNRLGLMSPKEFADLVALAQMTPGPIGLNAATYIGQKAAGLPGAMAGTLGVMMPSVIIGLVIAYFLRQYQNNQYVQNALGGIRPAVVGLLASAIIFFAETSIFTCSFSGLFSSQLTLNWRGLVIFSLALICCTKFKINLIWLLLTGGLLGFLLV